MKKEIWAYFLHDLKYKNITLTFKNIGKLISILALCMLVISCNYFSSAKKDSFELVSLYFEDIEYVTHKSTQWCSRVLYEVISETPTIEELNMNLMLTSQHAWKETPVPEELNYVSLSAQALYLGNCDLTENYSDMINGYLDGGAYYIYMGGTILYYMPSENMVLWGRRL